MHSKWRAVLLFTAALSTLLAFTTAEAKITSTESPGNWQDAIWDNGAPDTGDTVGVNHDVTLSTATPVLEDLSTTATLTFSGSNAVIRANTVSVSGSLTHEANSDTNGVDEWQVDNRVYVVCSDFTLTGTIDIAKKGFKTNPLNATTPGLGPGHGYGQRGAGYGGLGGGNPAGYGLTYGAADDPRWPGSSGGNRDNAGVRRGGAGGGLFILEATGHAILNGTINADGESQDYFYGGGGGSGGGVNIRCATLESTHGVITANGGNGAGFAGGSGGGGRIAIHVTDTAGQDALPPTRMTLAARFGPAAGPVVPPYYLGDYGTLYIDHGALMPTAIQDYYAYLYGPAASSWTRSSLALTNSWLSFASNVSASVFGDLRLSGSSLLGLHDTFVGGNVLLTNASRIAFVGDATNGVSPSWGSLVRVNGAVSIATNCVLYAYSHPTNGGSVHFRVGDLLIDNGGLVSADEAGFAGAPVEGYGPGRGTGSVGGAGYGGRGGRYPAFGGATYGSATAPALPGSGGAGNAGRTGARGGGLIHVTATNTIAIDGAISANGGNAANFICGGSGGGIYLWADTFPATYGTLRANGGGGSGNYGAGGGGRIARLYRNDGFDGTVTVDGGSGGTYPGTTGTVYRALNGDYVTLSVEGSPERHGVPSPYDYGNNGVPAGTVVSVRVDSPADEAEGRRYRCLGWQVRNEAGYFAWGANNETVISVTTNTTLTFIWTNEYALACSAGPGGRLTSDPSGWYLHGERPEVVAAPDANRYFSQWTGDYAPASWTSMPLVAVMTRPRAVRANFGVRGGETKTWIGGTGLWFDSGNWSPEGIPARQDAVAIDTGEVTLDESFRLGSLSMAGGATLTFRKDTVLSTRGNMFFTGSDTLVTLNQSTLLCNGSLSLLDGADMVVNSGPTNALTDPHGAYVEIGHNLLLESGSWIYPASDNTNGGSAFFVVDELHVAEGAGFDADGRGFRGGLSPVETGSANGTVGWGYGHGNMGEGAGYGGRGGGWGGGYGLTYGSEQTPLHPGSGGGGNGGNPYRSGGNGGGLIRVDASRNITLLGTMTANGNPGGGDYGTGGGSGGGIYLRCNTFAGAGALSANGGAGHGTTSGTAGGGGRIAVWKTNHRFTGTASVSTNAPTGNPPVEIGTIYWGFIPAYGSALMVF